MTYITIVGEQDEYATLWTGGANYAGMMDPGKFKVGVVSNTHEVSIVDAERKYFDWRASDQYGIPIYRPLTSGARRNTVPLGYRFGAHYGAFGGVLTTNRQSPDVRSERNASDVTSGGTSSGKKSGGSTIKPTKFVDSRGETRHSCPRGYELKRIGRRFMCVKR